MAMTTNDIPVETKGIAEVLPEKTLLDKQVINLTKFNNGHLSRDTRVKQELQTTLKMTNVLSSELIATAFKSMEDPEEEKEDDQMSSDRMVSKPDDRDKSVAFTFNPSKPSYAVLPTASMDTQTSPYKSATSFTQLATIVMPVGKSTVRPQNFQMPF